MSVGKHLEKFCYKSRHVQRLMSYTFKQIGLTRKNSRRGTYIILLVREMCALARQPWYWSTFVNLGPAFFPPAEPVRPKKEKRTALFWLGGEILPVWITDLFHRSLHSFAQTETFFATVQARKNFYDIKLCVQQSVHNTKDGSENCNVSFDWQKRGSLNFKTYNLLLSSFGCVSSKMWPARIKG